jgi:hypothetical protein
LLENSSHAFRILAEAVIGRWPLAGQNRSENKTSWVSEQYTSVVMM